MSSARFKPAAATVRRRLTSVKAWQLEPEPSSFAPKGSHLSNADMDPVPPERRVWTTSVFIAYWISDAFTVPVWDMASSIIANGLSYRQAIPAIFLGFFIISIPITLNGTIGAQTHLSFPVLNRSSFGFWLSYFPVISRVVLACFWFGVQSYTGGECVYQMLRAIWPSFRNIHNALPADADITSAQMIAYFIYWVIQLPLVMLGPARLRWLFLAKAFICPAAGIAMMAWGFAKGSGEIFDHHATISGTAFSYAWLSSMNAVIGNYATLSVNIPDFSRYAPHPRTQYVQLLIIAPLFTFIAFMGIVTTSAGYKLYGEYLWDPLRLIDKWDNRAAAFFAAFAFALATIGSNVSANSLSGANDLTAICPRYINIKRGSFLVALLGGWAIPSWKILYTSSGFLTFMAGYTVFLGPFAAIMVADYFLVKRGRLDIPELYDPHGKYRYTAGCNWRALVAMLFSIPPTLPGLGKAITPSLDVSLGAQHLYSIAWLYGFFTAGTLYTVLSLAFPAKASLGGATVWGKDVATDGSPTGTVEDTEKGDEFDKDKRDDEDDARAYEVTVS